MKFTGWWLAVAMLPALSVGQPPAKLPYVYTEWQQFTVADGLPNDHIFAVAVSGHEVWVGTENGLALIDKKSGKIKSWKEEDGLPWRVVSSLAVNEKTGELWIGLFGGGLGSVQRGPIRSLASAQQRIGQ